MAIALVAGECAGAEHFALATAANKLFLLRAEGYWTGTSAGPLQVDLGGTGISMLGGVATYGEWVYLLDSATNRFYAGKLVSSGPLSYRFAAVDFDPDPHKVRKYVELKNAANEYVSLPKRLAVDDQGDVYVIGGNYVNNGMTYNNFAYVSGASSDWTTHAITISNLGNAPMMDIAACGSGINSTAVISSLLNGQGLATHWTKTQQAAVSTNPAKLTDSYNPGAVAVTTGIGSAPLAYVLSTRSSADDTDMFGTLDVINLVTGTTKAHYVLPDHLSPQDITVVQSGTDFYLAIIGTPQNYVEDGDGNLIPDPALQPAQAWKVKLSPDGLPDLPSRSKFTWNPSDHSFGQMIVASGDGQVVWTAHPGLGEVKAWTFNTWGNHSSSTFSGTVGEAVTSIAAFIGIPVVPEPSSMVALAVFAVGAAAMFRRKR